MARDVLRECSRTHDGPAYYAYSAPAPPGLELEKVRPAGAGWNAKLGEFILMYDDVRKLASPHDALMEFLESTYEAGARLAKWDRAALEMREAFPGGSR